MEDAANNAVGSVERREEARKSPEDFVRYWLNALAVADKQEEDWRKKAESAVDLYTGKRHSAFNILHSNVETLVPALYNSTPVPDVRTRYNDANELARKAGQLLERGIAYQIDQYDLDAVAKLAVLHMQLPGRAVARVDHRQYTRGDQVVWQEAVCSLFPWQHFRRGPGHSWSEVPWIAYELFLTRDELVALAGEDIGRQVPLDAVETGHEKDKADKEKSAFRRGRVWQIWDRETRTVISLAPGWTRAALKVEPDPYQFLDFFPSPPPLQAISDPDTLVPIVPYEVYRAQAEELSEISRRILKLTQVIKWRGFRAPEVPDLDDLSTLEDGQFKPMEAAMAVLGSGKALDETIWSVPIADLVATVRELIAQREAIKQAIYEITGIADIIRGATNPNETLGAQQIKAQWGSLRIANQQREVQRFIRDIFRLKAEIIAAKFSPDTLAMINGEPVAPEVLALLRSDVRRTYMVDVETDSTVRGDLARAQQNMTNFLTGSAQFFQTFVPLLQSQMLPPQVAQAAIAIYESFARQFKLGKQAEDALAALAQAAKDYPIGEPKPEEKAKQEEARQISRAGAIAEVKKTEAEAAKAAAQAQAALRPPAPPQRPGAAA